MLSRAATFTATIFVLLALSPVASAASVTYHVHGTSPLADNRAPGAVALTMDTTPGAEAQPRIVLGHSGGADLAGNAIVASFVATEEMHLGDSDPATPDNVVAVVCISETTQTAFVPRALIELQVDGVPVARRLSNDFGLPANAPSCKSIDVTLGQFVDSQTEENSGALDGVLDADGNVVVPSGKTLAFSVDVDTALGGPIWGYYYDAPAYPTSITLPLAPVAGAAASGPVYSNLTGTLLSQTLSAPTNGTYVYNFTGVVPSTFVYDAKGTGSAVVLLRDASGKDLFNKTLAAPDNGTVEITEAQAGNWSYVVTYMSFNGTLALDVKAPAASSSTATSTTSSRSTSSGESSSSDSTSASGNETVADSGGKKDSPSVAPPLVGLALLALVGVVRRRR